RASFGEVVNVLIVQAFNALSLSSILLLVALGLVFSFGLMNVINMAHGEFIMVGAYVNFVVQRLFQAAMPDLSGIYIFVALALVALCIAAIYLYVTRSAPGRRMRAVMQNREMASCLGLSTARVDATTFALGSGLAGIAGCAVTLLGSIGPALGTYYIVDAFMVVVLGGVGQIAGTILAALAIGGFNTAFELGS